LTETKNIVIASGVDSWNIFEQYVEIPVTGLKSVVLHGYGSALILYSPISGGSAEFSVNDTIIGQGGFSAISGFAMDKDITSIIVPNTKNKFKVSFKDYWGSYAQAHYWNLNMWLEVTGESVSPPTPPTQPPTTPTVTDIAWWIFIIILVVVVLVALGWSLPKIKKVLK